MTRIAGLPRAKSPMRLLQNLTTHYMVHDGEHAFPIPKQGLSKGTHEKILALADGGDVERDPFAAPGEPGNTFYVMPTTADSPPEDFEQDDIDSRDAAAKRSNRDRGEDSATNIKLMDALTRIEGATPGHGLPDLSPLPSAPATMVDDGIPEAIAADVPTIANGYTGGDERLGQYQRAYEQLYKHYVDGGLPPKLAEDQAAHDATQSLHFAPGDTERDARQGQIDAYRSKLLATGADPSRVDLAVREKFATGKPLVTPADPSAGLPAVDTATNIGVSAVPPPFKNQTSPVETSPGHFEMILKGNGEDSGGAPPPRSDGPTVIDAGGGKGNGELDEAFRKQVEAIQAETAAKQKALGFIADQQDRAADLEAQAAVETKQFENQRNEQFEKIAKSIGGLRIDPARGFRHLDQAAATVGFILGGIGSALGRTPNEAANTINKFIDSDLKSQYAEIGKRETLLSDFQKQTGSLRAADDLVRTHRMAEIEANVKGQLATEQSAEAQARGMDLLGKLQASRIALTQKAAKEAIELKYKPLLDQANLAQKAATLSLETQKSKYYGLDEANKFATGESTRALNTAKVIDLGTKAGEKNDERSALRALADTTDRTSLGGVQMDPRVVETLKKDARERVLQLEDGSYVLAGSSGGKKEAEKVINAGKNLNGVIGQMRQFQQDHGRTWSGSDANKFGSALEASALPLLNHVLGVQRLSAQDIEILKDQVMHPGSWRQDQVTQILDNLQELAATSRQSALETYTNIKKFGKTDFKGLGR